MWFSAFILLYVILWDLFIYLFIFMIVLLNIWIYYSIFSKNWFDLIWFDGMILVIISSIFLLMKYVSLKKIVLVIGQINKK